MKCYIGKIEEVNGSMEYDTEFLFITGGDPDEYMDKTAMEWRSGTDAAFDVEFSGYWNDGTLIRPDGWRIVPEEDFDVLKKYLTVL